MRLAAVLILKSNCWWRKVALQFWGFVSCEEEWRKSASCVSTGSRQCNNNKIRTTKTDANVTTTTTKNNHNNHNRNHHHHHNKYLHEADNATTTDPYSNYNTDNYSNYNTKHSNNYSNNNNLQHM
jgi:hypothetical protein